MLCSRRRGILCTNGQKTVKRQFWEEREKHGVQPLRIPSRCRSIVVPPLRRVDDQWIGRISRAGRQVVCLIETVEVETVGRLTIQHSASVSHDLLHGDAVTLRSWCKHAGRQELSL